jgi:hypothetical protein
VTAEFVEPGASAKDDRTEKRCHRRQALETVAAAYPVLTQANINLQAKGRDVPNFIGAPDTIRTCDLCLRRATLEKLSDVSHPRITVDDVTYMQPKAETASWSSNILLKLGRYFSARLMWPLPHGEEHSNAARLEP